MPPAARSADMHVCPLCEGPKPHGGGPILPGCRTVVIEHNLAARVGDEATCTGPPDVITLGSYNVLIEYRPAARLSDMTAHGGSVVTGCPSVIIAG